MRKIILLLQVIILALSISGQNITQKFYFDFGKSDSTNGNPTTSPDINGNYWNNIVSAESGSPSTKPSGYTVSIINSTNQSTPIVLTTTKIFRANGRKNGALLSPNPSLLGDLAIPTATEDYFFIENNLNDEGAFLLNNLDPTKAYKFYVFGSREATDNRTSIFSISGKNGSHGLHQTTGVGIGTENVNANDNKIFESGLIVPKANGEILFEVGILTGGYAYINAMKIEEYSGFTLPSAEKKIFIDFGKNNNGLDGSPTSSPDVNGHYWNNMYSNGDGATTDPAGKTINLVYSDNEAGSYVLETGSSISFNGARNGGLLNPDPTLLGDIAISTATHDYLFIDGNIPAAILYFKNLNLNKKYRFNILGSRISTTDPGNRIGYIEIVGSDKIIGVHQMGGKDMGGTSINQNIKNIFVSDLITPTVEGTITLNLTKWLGGFAHVNVIKLEEIGVNENATSISIVGENISVCGATSQMSISPIPLNSFYPPVTWSVDNTNIATITSTGKLYPKENGIVTVTATSTTSLTNTKVITISNQNVADYSLGIMGSSVPWGQGADSGKGYAQLFAQYLATNAVNSWNTFNISIPGNNTTDVLNRWESDLLPTCSRYVYYGLSLGNEGIHEKGQPAFDSYRDNMQILIKKARDLGKIPLLGNNYPRGDFNTIDYNYVKQLNLLIHQWNVPSINFLGSIDNGSGQWVSAYQYDNAHPNTYGHAEMYYAIVPSLMDALAAGKPQPVKNETTSLTMDKTAGITRIGFVPENITHSFTLSFSFKTNSIGTLASLLNENSSTARLKIDTDGKLYYETESILSKLSSPNILNDGQWHQISLSHYYAWGRTFLYVDGVQVTNTTIIEKLVPVHFYLNDFQQPLESVDYKELFFHRAGMCPEEIAALYAGKMLKSSLEIYAPLDGSAATDQAKVTNLAQSLNALTIEKLAPTSVINPGKEDISFEKGKNVKFYSLTGQQVIDFSKPVYKQLENVDKGVYIVQYQNKEGKTISKKLFVK